jgi:hypothetical protein
MRMNNYAYLGAGMLIGVGIVFYQVDTPKADKCETYKVSEKVATAYVLKPPPSEVVYKACPQVTERVENVSEPEITKAEETKSRRRHRRWHRRWR